MSTLFNEKTQKKHNKSTTKLKSQRRCAHARFFSNKAGACTNNILTCLRSCARRFGRGRRCPCRSGHGHAMQDRNHAFATFCNHLRKLLRIFIFLLSLLTCIDASSSSYYPMLLIRNDFFWEPSIPCYDHIALFLKRCSPRVIDPMLWSHNDVVACCWSRQSLSLHHLFADP